ncbi:MAG TPA: NAD(P)H-dependent glycerol-3-phosphate dehydrogenase [Sedimentibacter sp.]|mgnify:CR=1 FL=1|nr:NAD(P)H-dependent glycerol-3-phosphate dehydrogenase [Sedimentibacter sp.]HHZ00314.1 NAD(P)H-dependent glycerol-3-phosphate dehydrogenase [Tissierellia bacterium]HOK49694.1 NAD(P)H-dependent glycerol-3-phosphate dehydrogenase [Sedimentibacter sp.]HOV26905.1 NAD(P)H-dependent glycerol-3-phosphate dehydrogenase [Pseudobacteroides sp.]HRC81051.1 NAD(P)H-dependent glycerol-3-phosphate dehydrogenase [Sedimentibacter sp.]
MNKKISVLGGGSWGTALSKLLSENGHKVTVWLRDEKQCKELSENRVNKKYLPNVKIPENVLFTSDINEAAKTTEILLLVIPTQIVRGVLRQIKDEYKNGKIIVNASKGIEIGSLSLVSDIVREETKNSIFAVLSGPSHAEEVGLSMPTAITIACEDKAVGEELQDIFMSEYFRVYTNDDVRGAELGGALKNIIALGAGISDGIGYGDNAKAALMNRGIVEIARLGIAMGADIHTFYGLTGIGDLIVTCTSKHSRNWNAGYLIGQGYTKDEAIKKVGMIVEGIPTTYAAYELSKKLNVDMPIVDAMYDVLENNADVKETVNKLMLRDKKEEKL